MSFSRLISRLRGLWYCKINRLMDFRWSSKVYIGRFSTIYAGRGLRLIRFGGNAEIRDHVTLRASGGEILIDDSVFINSYSSITARGVVKIGKGCLLGEGVRIYDHDHKVENARVQRQEFHVGHVIVEDDVWIGSGAILLRGAYIGKGSIICAGAIVKGRVPEGTVVIQKRHSEWRNVL